MKGVVTLAYLLGKMEFSGNYFPKSKVTKYGLRVTQKSYKN